MNINLKRNPHDSDEGGFNPGRTPNYRDDDANSPLKNPKSVSNTADDVLGEIMKNSPQSSLPPQKPRGGSNSKVVVLGIAVFLLLGAVVFLLFQNTNNKEEIEQKDDTIKKLDSEIKDLEKDIASKENELTSTANEKEELLGQLKQLQEKISYYKISVNKLMAEGTRTKEEKDKLQARIDQLIHYDNINKEKIKTLQTQIDQLKAENEGLKGEIQQKNNTIGEQQERLLSNEIKIEAGSKVQVSAFKFTGDYGGGIFGGKNKELDENDVLRASRIKKLHICFTLVKNDIAKPGNRTIYVVIKSPMGTVLKNASGEGYFKVDGQDKNYSAGTIANFTGAATQVCADYIKPNDVQLTKGQYIAEVYGKAGNEGAYLMGAGSFNLK